MPSKKGTLNYKAGCGALVKVPCNDLYHATRYNMALTDRPIMHRCDDTHECKAVFISVTYDEIQEPEQ